MLIFSLLFLIPIAFLLIKLFLINTPSIWESASANVNKLDFKYRTYKGKYKAIFLKVTYTYTVQGKSYTSNRISLDIFDLAYNDTNIDNDDFVNSLKNNVINIEYISWTPSISVIRRAFYEGKDHIAVILGLTMMLTVSLLAIYLMSRT